MVVFWIKNLFFVEVEKSTVEAAGEGIGEAFFDTFVQGIGAGLQFLFQGDYFFGASRKFAVDFFAGF